MSALPFHRKYRPQTFNDYIGNDRIKKSAMAALRADQKPQVILMTGHAGTGKTTMARLLAKEYLCENRHPVAGACGKCRNCLDTADYIETGDTGMLMNLQEIDVTDSNKREDIDRLLEEANTPSFTGDWKIFILDECHMMTNTAQNRLLKNLEEPAEKVLMVLCTTDPQKLLETIISRCQYKFQVEKPTRDELGGLLAKVCIKEGVEYESRALSLICAKGDFVPRKTLVALEQVVREKKEVSYNNTVEVLNVIADKYFFEFYRLLLTEPIDVMEYVKLIGQLKMTMSLKEFIDSLITFTLRGIYVANGANVEALDRSEISQYRSLFKQFGVGDTAYLLNLLVEIKESRDIEARLLLIGYTGLKRGVNHVVDNTAGTSDSIIIDETMTSTGQEKSSGSKNHLDSITMTEDEQKDFVESNKTPMTPEDLAKLFSSTIIKTE